MRVAVTATGGGVGQSVIKALKGKHDVIALDSSNMGAGIYMVDESYLIPQANSLLFISTVLDICKNKKIDILFSGMDCELEKLSDARSLFLRHGIHVIVSDANIIDIADDKLKTQTFLKDNGLPYLKTSDDFHYFLKKKKGGARSRGVSEINCKDYDGYVSQEYVEGDEYTCGTLTLGGVYMGCIVMRRILRDGDTYKAFVEKNDIIEELCEKVCNILKPYGALNIQLRMRDGVPYIFELNARCSGTTAARALAGFNEPLMITDYIDSGKHPQFDIKYITILRYWQELIVENEDIANK